MATMPNFLVIGAGKAGTTALFVALRQHPDVFLSPRKEPRFFAFPENSRIQFRGPGAAAVAAGIVTSRRAYEALFREAGTRRAVGEISPLYLYSASAAERIRRELPGVRLLAILRDPAERAFSNWLHKRRDGIEPLADFRAALDDEDRRVRDGWPYVWHYVRRGYYHAQVASYLRLFDRGRLKVFLYEDWRGDNARVLREIFEFLEVDPGFAAEPRSVNASVVPRSAAVHAALLKVGAAVPRLPAAEPLRHRARAAVLRRLVVRPPLPPDQRARLVAAYREDVLRLQDLLGRDLSRWLAAS